MLKCFNIETPTLKMEKPDNINEVQYIVYENLILDINFKL